MATVHVVGAGPAGSIAAMSALRSGHEVVISEDHGRAGEPRNCSGLFSKDGLDSLSEYLDYRRFVINPINGADIFLGGEKFSVRRKEPVAYVCDRAAMDQWLADRAEDEGASVAYGERITDMLHLRSSNVIGADGPFSSVAGMFGFPRISRHAATLQAEFAYEAHDPHILEMHISSEHFPGFFGWVIPHGSGIAEFGV